jgi:hypothetical protein
VLAALRCKGRVTGGDFIGHLGLDDAHSGENLCHEHDSNNTPYNLQYPFGREQDTPKQTVRPTL